MSKNEKLEKVLGNRFRVTIKKVMVWLQKKEIPICEHNFLRRGAYSLRQFYMSVYKCLQWLTNLVAEKCTNSVVKNVTLHALVHGYGKDI